MYSIYIGKVPTVGVVFNIIIDEVRKSWLTIFRGLYKGAVKMFFYFISFRWYLFYHYKESKATN